MSHLCAHRPPAGYNNTSHLRLYTTSDICNEYITFKTRVCHVIKCNLHPAPTQCHVDLKYNYGNTGTTLDRVQTHD